MARNQDRNGVCCTGTRHGALAIWQVNGPGEITQLRLQLPQVQHAPYVVDDGRAFGAGGSSQFTVAINPANQGVTITRRYDPEIANQVANIYVDGTLAGQWSTGAAVQHNRRSRAGGEKAAWTNQIRVLRRWQSGSSGI